MYKDKMKNEASRKNFVTINLYQRTAESDLKVKLLLAHALLMSQVLYGIEVVYGTGSILVNRLKRIVNNFINGNPRPNIKEEKLQQMYRLATKIPTLHNPKSSQ